MTSNLHSTPCNLRGCEGAVFEPFVSTKRNGRGLGLFIIRELLAGDGGTIRLLSDRNEHGRLHEFELDFSGVENG